MNGMTGHLSILLIDPDQEVVQPLGAHLIEQGHSIEWARKFSAVSGNLGHDVAILAWDPAQDDLLEKPENMSIVLATRPENVGSAAAQLHNGVYRYILRPYQLVEADQVIQDVTLRKQTKQNGRKSLEIAQFLENTPDAIIAVDEDGKVTTFNHRAEVILKYRAEETIDQPVYQYYADGFPMAQKVKTLLYNSPDGRLSGFETAVLSSEGEVIPISLWAILLTNEQGNPAGSIGYFRDLRELQEIERLNHALLADAQATQVLEMMVGTLAEIFSCQASILSLYDHRDDALRVVECSGLPEAIKNRVLCKTGEGAIGEIFETNKPRHGLITKNERETEIAFDQLGDHILIHSYAAIPLAYPFRYGEETFGVVVLLNKLKDGVPDENGFSWIDKARLTALAGQIVGLVQRDLHRDSLRALLEVGTELAAIHQIDDILQKIAAVLVDILGYRAAYFRLVRADKKLVVRAEKGLRSVKSFYTTESEMGVVGRVVREKRIMAVYDLSKPSDYHHVDVMIAEGWCGMLAVPVMTKDSRVLGVLVCYTGRPHWFTENEKCLVNTFANLAAVALNNAFHFDNQSKEQELLASAIHVIQQNRDVNEDRSYWRELLQAAMQLTNAEYGSISIVNRGQGKIIPLWYQPYSEEYTAIDHPIEGHSIIAKVVKDGEGLLVSNVNDTQWQEEYYPARSETNSELALPLYDYESNKVAGVLNLESSKVGGFNENHYRVLESLLGVYASNIIHNPDQTERWNQMRSREDALHKAIAALSQTQLSGLSEGEILRAIIDQAVAVTDAKYGSLLLVEDDALAIVCTYPAERLATLSYEQSHYQLNGPGITVQVFNQQQSQIVDDVHKNPVFINTTGDTQSMLAVVLRDMDQKAIGVLNLEDPRNSYFTPQDEHTLNIFALLTGITRKFLAQANDLTEIKRRENQIQTFVRAMRNMGMKSHNWSGNVRVVAGRLERLNRLLQRLATHDEIGEELNKATHANEEILREITANWEELIKRIESSSTENLNLTSFLEERVNFWKTSPKYSRTNIELINALPETAVVHARRNDFEDILENLISNSARALTNMQNGRKPRIKIQAQLADQFSEVIIIDNGPGIPPELLPKLGEMPVIGQEIGFGAWLAAATIRNDLQGTIEWQNVLPYGVQARIRLPLITVQEPLNNHLPD